MYISLTPKPQAALLMAFWIAMRSKLVNEMKLSELKIRHSRWFCSIVFAVAIGMEERWG